MANKVIPQGIGKRKFSISISTKLIASFLFIIATGNIIFTSVGIKLIVERIVSEAQEKVRTDLYSAREIYHGELRHIYDVIRLTADRLIIKELILNGITQQYESEIKKLKTGEKLDILNITDPFGEVIFRSNNPEFTGDDQSNDEVIRKVLTTKEPAMATSIIPVSSLLKESSELADRAHFIFIDTLMARTRLETEETAGMMLKVAAPVFDAQDEFIGVLYGGVLLNRNYEIVDKIKQTVFLSVEYEGEDIGTATIFQDDVRISTNVSNLDGSRAIGTRVASEVYNQVVSKGQPWIGRAFVVNNWYITAYEPIKNIKGEIIGILYVGILEKKYTDIRDRAVLAFLTISLAGILLSIAFSIFISKNISGPVNQLVSVSKELAHGNLNVKVKKASNDELGELADAFNFMANALNERDERLKDFTRRKIMESDRLALIGQLSANVAHELNNPLQGIVTYSHLLLETNNCDPSVKSNLQKIVNQANRCRDIIRGLLDFSRQRKPDKMLCDINIMLKDCLSLLENQALFHNVEIITHLDNQLPMVVVDPSQIERVFINMVINAAEAMEGIGRLLLISRLDSQAENIEIEITDTGNGIEEADLDRIFDPFFTTKETGHGVGLGLAISYGIIKEHKGSIAVSSQVGIGTTFVIRLPLKALPINENEQSL